MNSIIYHSLCTIQFVLVLALAACYPSTTPIPVQFSPSLTLPTQVLPPSPIPADTAIALPSPTSTQILGFTDITLLPTSKDQPGKWSFQHPYSDPNAAELITPSEDEYRLEPGFEVAKIELVYRWIGIGDRVRQYQQVVRQGDGFSRNGTPIPAASVEKLVKSISHLREQPRMLSATTHTDDYPFWAIELTGVDGNIVQLYSESNAPNYVPWNVMYNRKNYSQFDGEIAKALADLFEVVEGETLASTWWGSPEEGYLQVHQAESSHEEAYNFTGLLPLYWDFNYTPDPLAGELRGFLSGPSWVGQVEGIPINWLDNLKKMELDTPDFQRVACELKNKPVDSGEWVYWEFTCPVGVPAEILSFQFPIQLTYSNPAGQTYILHGQLADYWEKPTTLPAVSFPQEIQTALDASPVASDLLGDHLAKLSNPIALANLSTGLLDHQWEADVVLLGQVQAGGQVIPYSVALHQVTVEDSQLVHWDLERSELEALLRAVLTLPITRRALEADPDLVLNLYYAEPYEHASISSDHLAECSGLPAPRDLPSEGNPLRAFSFNQPLEFYGMQILLMEDGPRIYHLSLQPASLQDSAWISLLPAELLPTNAPPFEEIFSRVGGMGVGVSWDENATEADIEHYKAMFEPWDVEITAGDHSFILEPLMFGITPDGRLELVNCQAP